MTSFADLGMYGVCTSTEDVVRKKQPVMYGPRNQRGRRPSLSTSEDDKKMFSAYSIKLPSQFATTLDPSIANDIVNDDSPAAKQLMLEVKQSACNLAKFRDIPCGIGLQEQMLGDYSPRPARIRGRPRKAAGMSVVASDGAVPLGTSEEADPEDLDKDVCLEDDLPRDENSNAGIILIVIMLVACVFFFFNSHNM